MEKRSGAVLTAVIAVLLVGCTSLPTAVDADQLAERTISHVYSKAFSSPWNQCETCMRIIHFIQGTSLGTSRGYTVQQDQKPHFVLVHGLGHGAWCWYQLSTLLQEAGFQVTAIDLASAGIDKTIADDIDSIAGYLKPLSDFLDNLSTDQVILVGHSLGGLGVTYATEKYAPKITKAIYLAAVMPKHSEKLFSIVPPETLASFMAVGALDQRMGNPSNPSQVTSIIIGPNATAIADSFYNLSPKKDITLALTMLTSTPFAPMDEVLNLTDAKYGSVPRFYIRTGKDHAIVPSVQETIVIANPPYNIFSLDESDHSPFFSMPLKLTALLIQISNM